MKLVEKVVDKLNYRETNGCRLVSKSTIACRLISYTTGVWEIEQLTYESRVIVENNLDYLNVLNPEIEQ